MQRDVILICDTPPVPGILPAPSFATINKMQVTVTWTAPSPLPGVILRYDLAIGVDDFDPEGAVLYSGNATSVTIAKPASLGFRVRAATAVGEGPYSNPSLTISTVTHSDQIALEPYFYVPIAAGILLLILIVVSVVRRYRRRPAAEVFVKPKPDEWECEPGQITLGRKLGEGNFGIVFSASAYNISADLPGSTVVAVKMIAENATVEEKRSLLSEAELMKKFSKPWHENVCMSACSVMCSADDGSGDSAAWRLHTDRADDDCA